MTKITKAEVSKFSDSKELPRSIGRALLEKFGSNAESVFLNPTEEQYNAVMGRAWEIYKDPQYAGEDDSSFMVWPFESFKK